MGGARERRCTTPNPHKCPFFPLMIWLYKHIVQHKGRHICLLTQVVDANRFDKALAVAGVEVVAMVTTSNS